MRTLAFHRQQKASMAYIRCDILCPSQHSQPWRRFHFAAGRWGICQVSVMGRQRAWCCARDSARPAQLEHRRLNSALISGNAKELNSTVWRKAGACTEQVQLSVFTSEICTTAMLKNAQPRLAVPPSHLQVPHLLNRQHSKSQHCSKPLPASMRRRGHAISGHRYEVNVHMQEAGTAASTSQPHT